MPTRDHTQNPRTPGHGPANTAPILHRVPDRGTPAVGGWLRRVARTVAGGLLCGVGIALLVLPGPGLLLVLAGLVVLASEYAWARRLTGPVRTRAIWAARHSVATRPRIAGTALSGTALITAGTVWMLLPALPYGGIATGSSLLLSGILLLALLVHSHRRYRAVPP